MKRWCKRPPVLRATGAARQTPPGARSDSVRPRAARPSTRVDRRRRPATVVVDGWSPALRRHRTRPTGQPIRHLPSGRARCASQPPVVRGQSAESPQEHRAPDPRLHASGRRVRPVDAECPQTGSATSYDPVGIALASYDVARPAAFDERPDPVVSHAHRTRGSQARTQRAPSAAAAHLSERVHPSDRVGRRPRPPGAPKILR